MTFSKNGVLFGMAFKLPDMSGTSLFPAFLFVTMVTCCDGGTWEWHG